MRFEGTPLTQHFQLRNLSTILNRIEILRPGHILVTGDLTNYAQEGQFRSVHDQFLSVQTRLERSDGALNPELWTILPGNHDVTEEGATKDPIRPKLGMFFRWFYKAYDLNAPSESYNTAFPLIRKKLSGENGEISVRLIALDTTVNAPVWRVGVNARGRIDKMQMERLTRELGANQPTDITLIAMHHHPIVVPKLNSELEDYFLSLEDASGRELIKLCVNTSVSAILHGHFHYYSSWSGLTPHGSHMAIIGSPAGTVQIAGINEEFLELREADRETTVGVEEGLAVYNHRHSGDGRWGMNFTGIFLPCRPEPIENTTA